MNAAEDSDNSERPSSEAPKPGAADFEQAVGTPGGEQAAGTLGAEEVSAMATKDGETAPDEPDELELAYGEVADLKDKLLRAMAETENIRRRGERDKTHMRKYAVADFARDMLAVSDNLQRALSAVGDEARQGNSALAQLLEGVELTRKELHGHFDKHGIKEISPLGEKLDPNLHQAVVQLDDPEAAQGIVVQVMQPGYVIHDRLLRAAMVGVAKGVPAANLGEASPATTPSKPEDGQNVDTQA